MATLTTINFTSIPSTSGGTEACNSTWVQAYAEGFIKAPISGLVTIKTTSDDGIKLQVNDYVGITNWNTHAALDDTMVIPMVQGNYYPIKIWFAQGSGGLQLTFKWSGSGLTEAVIPTSAFYRSSNSFDNCPLKSGIAPSCAGSSALQIKQLTATNLDGLYWIDLGDGSGPKATYSIMNSAHGGGGWMLAMKGKDSASTFAYDSAYWKNSTLLNSERPSRNNDENVDAKYLPFTQSRATDVMVIFPDYSASTYKGAYPSSGDGFAWSENLSAMRPWTSSDGNSYNVNQGGDPSGTSACATYPSTMQTIFSNSSRCLIRQVNSTYSASTPYQPIGNGLFYSQPQIRFFGFNYASAATTAQMYKARFGFGWNENNAGDEGSNDGTGGLGLYTPGGLLTITSGTRNQCCATQNGVSGVNPSETNFGFELFVKNTTTLTISGNSSFRPRQGSTATSTYSVDGGNSPVFTLSPVISGLSIDASTGVVTAASSLSTGTYYETVTVVNSLGASAVKPVTIQVTAGSASTDTAMAFTGINFLQSTTESEFDVGTGTTFTLSAWINPTNVTGNRIIASKNGQYAIVISDGIFGFNMNGVSSGGSWIGATFAWAPAQTNQWQHVLLSRNGNTASFYLNGERVYVDTSLSSSNAIAGGSNQFTIGGISNEQYFIGQIDHVFLSSADRSGFVQSDMNTYQPSDASLVGHYDFNEGTGTAAFNRKSGSSSTTDLSLNTGTNQWLSVASSTPDASGPYTTVTFPRTYLTSNGGWTMPSSVSKAAAIVVGGGGGGGKDGGNGGGGGELRSLTAFDVSSSALIGVTVGVGGTPQTVFGGNDSKSGKASILSKNSTSIAQANGGAGGTGWSSNQNIAAGGSGGSGGTGSNGGSGGLNRYLQTEGLGGVGGDGPSSTLVTGSTSYYGGGGGGGTCFNSIGYATVEGPAGGRGGGGAGAGHTLNVGSPHGGSGLANTGGGGGAGSACNAGTTDGVNQRTNGGAGGSGLVVLKYITASAPIFTALAAVDTTTAGKTYSFVASGAAISPLTRVYKWETSTSSGVSWSTVTGATSETYTTTMLETTTSGAQFRYRVTITDSGTAGLAISESSTAYLVINPRIAVTASKTTFSQKYGLTDSTTASASLGTGSRTFSWTTRTGITWENTTTDNAKITVGPNLDVGTYSETLTVTDSVSATTTKVFSITITKGDQADLVIPTLGIRGTTLNLYVSAGGGGGGSVLYTLPSGGGSAGCTISVAALSASTVGTCDVTVTKETSSNYLEKVQVVTVSFIEYVMSVPQNQVGGGGQIGLNGETIFQTLASAPPTVSTYTNSASAGATISFTGTGFVSGYTVAFQDASGGEVTAAMTSVTSTSFSCVVPVSAISGPIIVRNNIGIKRLSFSVVP